MLETVAFSEVPSSPSVPIARNGIFVLMEASVLFAAIVAFTSVSVIASPTLPSKVSSFAFSAAVPMLPSAFSMFSCCFPVPLPVLSAGGNAAPAGGIVSVVLVSVVVVSVVVVSVVVVSGADVSPDMVVSVSELSGVVVSSLPAVSTVVVSTVVVSGAVVVSTVVSVSGAVVVSAAPVVSPARIVSATSSTIVPPFRSVKMPSRTSSPLRTLIAVPRFFLSSSFSWKVSVVSSVPSFSSMKVTFSCPVSSYAASAASAVSVVSSVLLRSVSSNALMRSSSMEPSG